MKIVSIIITNEEPTYQIISLGVKIILKTYFCFVYLTNIKLEVWCSQNFKIHLWFSDMINIKLAVFKAHKN